MRAFCILLLVTGCAAPASKETAGVRAPPIPETPAVARSVDVELTDTSQAGTKTTHYTLAIVDDFGWSELASSSGGEHLKLKARSNRARGAQPTIVSVELSRDAQGEPNMYIAQSTIFSAGRRTVLGHVERAGGATDVAMVTR